MSQQSQVVSVSTAPLRDYDVPLGAYKLRIMMQNKGWLSTNYISRIERNEPGVVHRSLVGISQGLGDKVLRKGSGDNLPSAR